MLSDAALVLRARGGDELAFQRLADRYRGVIFRLSSQYYLQGAEPQDLRQEGMYGLYKATRDYSRNKGSFANFAELCIRRQIITAVKTATRGKHAPLNDGLSLAKPVFGGADTEDTELQELLADPRSEEPHARLEAEGEFAQVVDLIACRLSETEREALLGPALLGESYEETAARTGLSFKQIDNARQRATKKLAAALARAA